MIAPSPHKSSVLAGSPLNSECGCRREFFGNRFVYAIVSARARGFSVGVNMNPDKFCNFDCEYCEVDRRAVASPVTLDVDIMTEELQRLLRMACSEELYKFPGYQSTPRHLMRLRHVALSGEGEPTLCPQFLGAVRGVVHVRALGQFPFFKIVLITNATGLNLRDVQAGLKLFMPEDEIWVKLEAGTQDYFAAVNRPDCSLEKILENILHIARERPVIIQSLFPLLHNQEPSPQEIEQYALRLKDLKQAGAKIPLVQIYSANRRAVHTHCEHLPLKTLANIARRVRYVSGLNAEIF